VTLALEAVEVAAVAAEVAAVRAEWAKMCWELASEHLIPHPHTLSKMPLAKAAALMSVASFSSPALGSRQQ